MERHWRRPKGLTTRSRRSYALRIFALAVATIALAATAMQLTHWSAPRPGQASSASPVVMVHGWQGLSTTGHDCAEGLVKFNPPEESQDSSTSSAGVSDDHEFGRLATHLAAHRPVFLARWTTSVEHTQDPSDAARCLATQIAEARSLTGAPTVDLVGHSMGGLIARHYVEGAARGTEYADDVTRLVTLGAPHRGVAPEVLVRLMALFNLANAKHGFLPCHADPGTCALASEAVAAYNAAHPPNTSVAYDFIAGARWTWTSWLLPGPDDGLITLASAAGANVMEEHARAIRVPEAHNSLFHPRNFYVNGTSTIRCISDWLGLSGAMPCDAPDALSAGIARIPGEPGVPVQPTEPVLGYSPLVVGEIAPERPFHSTIAIDPLNRDSQTGEWTIAASWGAGVGPALLALSAPDGVHHDANAWARIQAGSSFTEVLRADGSGAQVLSLPRTTAGTWSASLHAPVRGPEDAWTPATAPAAIFATISSTLAVRLDTPQRVWDHDLQSSVWHIRAEITDAGRPVDDADVRMTWHRPSGPVEYVLRPSGGGIYDGTLPGPASPHATQLDVAASGRNAAGWRWSRQVTSFLLGAPAIVWLPVVQR